MAKHTARHDGPVVELRGDIEREIVDVLDAVSSHLRITRMELVEKVLRRWADDKLHESRLVVRVSRGNGSSRTDAEIQVE